MPARANISVNDGEGTPVAHVFVPDGDVTDQVARYSNRNTSVPAASEILTIGVRKSSASASDVQTPGRTVSPNVCELKIKYPATFTDSGTGLTLVDYIDEMITSFKRHPRSSDQRGKNLRTMTANLLAAGAVVTVVEKNEPIW
jgi:hypothetical protein